MNYHSWIRHLVFPTYRSNIIKLSLSMYLNTTRGCHNFCCYNSISHSCKEVCGNGPVFTFHCNTISHLHDLTATPISESERFWSLWHSFPTSTYSAKTVNPITKRAFKQSRTRGKKDPYTNVRFSFLFVCLICSSDEYTRPPYQWLWLKPEIPAPVKNQLASQMASLQKGDYQRESLMHQRLDIKDRLHTVK